MDNKINNKTFYTFNVSFGTLVATTKQDLVSLKEVMDANIELNSHIKSTNGSAAFYGCFDPFWGMSIREKFYFAYPLIPIWYESIIEEFNKYFNNIKVKIEYESPSIFGHVVENMGQNLVYCRWTPYKDEENVEFKRAIFSMKFSPEYNIGIHKKLYYFIHHLFRMMSYSENWYIHLSDEDPKNNYLESLILYNNRIVSGRATRGSDKEYRGLSISNNVTLQNVLNADIPLLVNIAFSFHSSATEKQTSLLSDLNISKDQTNNPKRDARLEKLNASKTYYTGTKDNNYGVTNQYALMEITNRKSYKTTDDITVVILDQLKEETAVGGIFDVSSRYFTPITLEEWRKKDPIVKPTIYTKYMDALEKQKMEKKEK